MSYLRLSKGNQHLAIMLLIILRDTDVKDVEK